MPLETKPGSPLSINYMVFDRGVAKHVDSPRAARYSEPALRTAHIFYPKRVYLSDRT